MDDKFQLTDYTNEISKIALENGCSDELALDYFITNLTVMNEFYKGASNVYYNVVGQQWNSLLNAEKLQQRQETLARLGRHTRGGKN